MERFYQNHVEAVPATSSGVNQYEYPVHYMLQNVPLNDIHYGGAYHNHTRFSYGLMPVGNTINTCQSYSHGARSAAKILPCGSQFNYNQPMFHRNPTKFQYDMAAANNSYNGGGPAAKNYRGQLVHTGIVHNQEMFNGSSLPVGSGDTRHPMYHIQRTYSHNEGHPSTESYLFHSSPANAHFSALNHDTVDGYSHPMSGCDQTCINEGIIQRTNHGANLSQFSNLPVVQGSLQQFIAKIDDGISSKVVNGGARCINEDPSKGGFEGFVASPKHFGSSQTVLPVKNKARLSEMSLSITSDRNIPNHRSSSYRKHDYKNRLGTNPSYPTKFLGVSSTLRTWRSTNRAKQSGQQDKTQYGKSAYSITDPSPPSKSENQKASAPHQVWRKKTQAQAAQPSSSRSKRSRKRTTPVYHITGNGFDERREPVGHNCEICTENLSHSPTDDEFEYYDGLDEPSTSNLPEVAVLSCGHTFHSQCLQFITPEERSRDPPCYLCSNGNS